MLDYFSNLMKDVSDFSRNLTRVFHDIVLTNMEVDCLQWSDRDKLDRICRTLMLKDTVPQVNLIASKALLARKKRNWDQRGKQSRKTIVALLLITELLARSISMCVSTVMVFMSVVHMVKNLVQNLVVSRCRNALVHFQNILVMRFSDRMFYNHDFVHKELLTLNVWKCSCLFKLPNESFNRY